MTPETRTDMEANLIGWMLSNPSNISNLHGISVDLFRMADHNKIIEEILHCLDVAEPIHPGIVGDRIDAKAGISEGVTRKYLLSCMTISASMIFVADYIRVLEEENRRSRIRKLCEAVLESEAGPEEMGGELIDGVQEILKNIRSSRMRSEAKVGESILDSMKKPSSIYSTGISKLDQCMGGGLHPNKCYGVAARKKIGKTCLAATISGNLSRAGVKHLFVCAEMSDEEIHQRVLCRAIESYPSAFRSGYSQSAAFQRKLADEVIASKNNTIYLNSPGITFEQLRRNLSIAVLRHKITGFILDYWQLVGGKEARKSTSEHLDEVAQWVATFCRQHGLWALVMAQINQDGNTRGSEGIRLAFDQVYQLHSVGDDIGRPERWLEMLETRYTPWQHIGDERTPGLLLNEKGPYFEQVAA